MTTKITKPHTVTYTIPTQHRPADNTTGAAQARLQAAQRGALAMQAKIEPTPVFEQVAAFTGFDPRTAL